jgi:hypothetical protein
MYVPAVGHVMHASSNFGFLLICAPFVNFFLIFLPAPLGTDLALDPSIPGPIYKPRIGDWNSKHDRVVGGRALHNKAQRSMNEVNSMIRGTMLENTITN